LEPWLLPLFLLLLLLLSYDVIGVLVLAGARQEGPCHDVLFCGFCGLVPVRVLGFPPVFGFCGFCFHSFFFLLSSFFFCFGVLFVCLRAPLCFF
jgi:hypothetical protein